MYLIGLSVAVLALSSSPPSPPEALESMEEAEVYQKGVRLLQEAPGQGWCRLGFEARGPGIKPSKLILYSPRNVSALSVEVAGREQGQPSTAAGRKAHTTRGQGPRPTGSSCGTWAGPSGPGLSLLIGERGFREDLCEAGVTNACGPAPHHLALLGVPATSPLCSGPWSRGAPWAAQAGELVSPSLRPHLGFGQARAVEEDGEAVPTDPGVMGEWVTSRVIQRPSA